MRKIVMMISLLMTILLVAGCVSIPLGDGGKLEVSKEGLNIDMGEEESLGDSEEIIEPEVIEEEKEIDVVNEEKEIDIDITEENENDVTEEKSIETKEETKSTVPRNDSSSCGEFVEDPETNDIAIQELLELLPAGFPIADCVQMGSTNESYDDYYLVEKVSSSFTVEDSWKNQYEQYKTYYEASDFGRFKKEQDIKSKFARLSASPAEFDLNIRFDEYSEGIVTVAIYFDKYDEPRVEE